MWRRTLRFVLKSSTTMKYLVALFITFFTLISHAQEVPFVIEKKGIFKKTVIKKCGFELTNQQFIEFIANDPLMDRYTRPLAGIHLTNILINATGSILSTWPLLQLQFDRDPNLNLTYAGLGMVVGSIILNRLFLNKARKAAIFYNNGYQKPLSTSGIFLKPAHSGLGIALTF